MLEEWVEELKAELAVDETLDLDAILDVARVVAHKVERRAAPVSTFIAGFAAARSGDAGAALAQTMEAARRRPGDE